MARFALLATLGVLLSSSAAAESRRLVFDLSEMVAGGDSASDTREASALVVAPELNVVLGPAGAASRTVTIEKGALLDATARPDGKRPYPRYELIRTVAGMLSANDADLQVEAELSVTWSAQARPQLYDVVLTTMSPDGTTTGGVLTVKVEAWRKGADRSSRPSFSAEIPATLEAF